VRVFERTLTPVELGTRDALLRAEAREVIEVIDFAGDRMRFEAFWGWAYRFEAYTPAPKRKLGYYALPLLWNDEVIGWANVQVVDGRLDVKLGYVKTAPRSAAFRSALEEEMQRLNAFLGL
jgi:uncharacterized protein YcaQ